MSRLRQLLLGAGSIVSTLESNKGFGGFVEIDEDTVRPIVAIGDRDGTYCTGSAIPSRPSRCLGCEGVVSIVACTAMQRRLPSDFVALHEDFGGLLLQPCTSIELVYLILIYLSLSLLIRECGGTYFY